MAHFGPDSWARQSRWYADGQRTKWLNRIACLPGLCRVNSKGRYPGVSRAVNVATSRNTAWQPWPNAP
eukprot:585971-Amphidinium_carterae.1